MQVFNKLNLEDKEIIDRHFINNENELKYNLFTKVQQTNLKYDCIYYSLLIFQKDFNISKKDIDISKYYQNKNPQEVLKLTYNIYNNKNILLLDKNLINILLKNPVNILYFLSECSKLILSKKNKIDLIDINLNDTFPLKILNKIYNFLLIERNKTKINFSTKQLELVYKSIYEKDLKSHNKLKKTFGKKISLDKRGLDRKKIFKQFIDIYLTINQNIFLGSKQQIIKINSFNEIIEKLSYGKDYTLINNTKKYYDNYSNNNVYNLKQTKISTNQLKRYRKLVKDNRINKNISEFTSKKLYKKSCDIHHLNPQINFDKRSIHKDNIYNIILLDKINHYVDFHNNNTKKIDSNYTKSGLIKVALLIEQDKTIDDDFKIQEMNNMIKYHFNSNIKIKNTKEYVNFVNTLNIEKTFKRSENV